MTERVSIFKTFIHRDAGLKVCVVPASFTAGDPPPGISDNDRNLIGAARQAQATVTTAGYRCLACNKRMKVPLSAVVFVQFKGEAPELHAICTRCGHSDETVTQAAATLVSTYDLPGQRHH
jgi:hypothetical protein